LPEFDLFPCTASCNQNGLCLAGTHPAGVYFNVNSG
jgi:hypothetical protein